MSEKRSEDYASEIYAAENQRRSREEFEAALNAFSTERYWKYAGDVERAIVIALYTTAIARAERAERERDEANKNRDAVIEALHANDAVWRRRKGGDDHLREEWDHLTAERDAARAELADLGAELETLRRAATDLLGQTDDLRDCWRPEIVKPKDGGVDRASSNMEHNHLTYEAVADLRKALTAHAPEPEGKQ